MGLFDLLRGLVPGAAQLLARNAWMASANPPSSWRLAPPGDDTPDAPGEMLLRDLSDGPGPTDPMPLPDWSNPSFDDIHAQLLAGLASRIGPEHFALNPDNWAAPPPARPLISPPFSNEFNGLALDQGSIRSVPARGFGDADPLWSAPVSSTDFAPNVANSGLPSTDAAWPLARSDDLRGSRIGFLTYAQPSDATTPAEANGESSGPGATGVSKLPSDKPPNDGNQIAQLFPPLVEFFLQKPPIIPFPPEALKPLDQLPPGSAGGSTAGKSFPRSYNDKPEGTPCQYCGTPTTREPGPRKFSGDHIQPRSRGGNAEPENHINSCRTCNLRKGARTPREWYDSLSDDGA
jgi:hypothetical protein